MAGEWILVVDDTRENREFIVEYILQPSGYRTLTAKDGQEGLELALQHKPDLILLDLQMPRLNGIQVLEKLREADADIPVILMTFHGSEEVAIQVQRLGVRDYVKKPFTVDEMTYAVERIMDENRLKREKEALTQRVLQANRDLQQRLQELNVLYSVGKQVTALLEMNQLLPQIVDAAVKITQSQEGFLYLMDSDRNLLLCRAQKLHTQGHAEAVDRLNNDNPLAAHCAKTAQPLLLMPEQLANKNPRGLIAAAYCPLLIAGRVVGVLGVGTMSQRGHIFTKHDSALLSALGDYAAIAIENSRNYEALKQAKDVEKEQIVETFERFVPPAVVKQALRQTGSLQPGGAKRIISVLFADIRGYTTWSEELPPEQILTILNDYLSMAAEIVMGWEGTLDKFMGDGLMAFFNAPDEQGDYVYRAADTALALIRAADEVSRWGSYKLSFSIGVNVGEAVVGYVGTPRAMNYTAVGDVVNVAKRLQEVASPGQILIEESVLQHLGDQAQTRMVGKLPLRGRRKEAYAYELMGLNPASRND